ncbi:hypothetical protein AEM42_10990 [Betaproteobacteria bacterium UKL13-2]|jgi:hypothetical protein|nr:hypothetical protein AEM42_10990 [Betaproteobacteria bacterium UKL13-2]
MLLTENQLDTWVRGNAREAQGVIVELVWRLVAASSPRPKERRFPLGDSIGQHGPDGVLDVDYSFDPFVPEGRSFWEIGTGEKPGDKATEDYDGLVSGIPKDERVQSTFVFVTPISGRRSFPHTWKDKAQASWLRKRRKESEWLDVRIIDGTKLIDWIRQFPPVEVWLANIILGHSIDHIETPEQRWSLLRSYGEPPSLAPTLFLANREEATTKINEVFAGTSIQLRLNTHFPDQVADFVAAAVQNLDDVSRVDAAGRCVIVSSIDAWNNMVQQPEKLVLVADATLDLTGDAGTKLIQKARRANHAIVFGGPTGGIPDPTSVALSAPRSHHVREALVKCGYGEERARTLAQKSGGNLGTLLRCLQNLSVMPEWAESTAAAELAIAVLLGSWAENSDADRTVVEGLSGNGYGEWIGKMREITHRPGTPLTQRDGSWRFVSRYEGWHALGPRIFDEHLEKLQSLVTAVFVERDPQFDLPTNERYASRMHGKVMKHSQTLRNGLAESLALLGSFPNALVSTSVGKAEATAALTVRAVLSDADWERWAGLNDLLPLLAEAAPNEFLDAVERALVTNPCPFDKVFAQESGDFMGRTYMSGVLWSLETLAWSAEHLSRVAMCLGELASRDPGGKYSNRPANSLSTILLPWMPQTCAPIAKRCSAVSMLIRELPEVGWKLLLSLLPNSHSISSGSRRPAWRQTIPDDWAKGVTRGEYWEQTDHYSKIAIATAKSDPTKLVELIRRIENLPQSAFDQLLTHIGSAAVIAMPETNRLSVWTALVDLATKHRKYLDADWSMGKEKVDKIAALTDLLAPNAPAFRHQRLFSERDFDLYEEKGNYQEQRTTLEVRRQEALAEVAASGGVPAVLVFSSAVQSPWRVGLAFGVIADPGVDGVVLPALLEAEQKHLVQLASGFVWSRFSRLSWQWVDSFDFQNWTPSQIGQFLAYLPFSSNTWDRSSRLLGTNEAMYWSKTTANPYETETGLDRATASLIQHGRPYAALRCVGRTLRGEQQFNAALAVQALVAALESSEGTHSIDTYETTEVIKALQSDPSTNGEDLFRVEWAYLPLLNRHSGASPKHLWHRLATEPGFFCEVIRLVFRSKNADQSSEDATEDRKNIATNAYRLLSNWQTPPGHRSDENYDGAALNQWLDAVKAECTATGHYEIAMTMLGHSLIYVPADPDGLWIHRAAASALNQKEATDMRDGFRTELFNSRGVHGFTSGEAEKNIATKYRAQADEVDAAGFYRLATTLRELADDYERQAERESKRSPFDD